MILKNEDHPQGKKLWHSLSAISEIKIYQKLTWPYNDLEIQTQRHIQGQHKNPCISTFDYDIQIEFWKWLKVKVSDFWGQNMGFD